MYALDSRTVYTGNSDFGFLTLGFFSSIQKQERKKKSNASSTAEKYNSKAGLAPTPNAIFSFHFGRIFSFFVKQLT